MEEIYNYLEGTSLADLWYLRRKSPTGRVTHLIHPVTLNAICGAAHCDWTWVDSTDNIKECQKCLRAARK